MVTSDSIEANLKRGILIKFLFKGILNEIEKDIFEDTGNCQPSIFLIYAHNAHGKAEPADADIAVKIIKWMHKLGINILSDKTPSGNQNIRSGESHKLHANILQSQLRILPNRKNTADIVILCGSQLMSSYLIQPFFTEYRHALKKLLTNHHLDNQSTDAILEDAIKSYEKNEAFHHVMTELIFLEERYKQSMQHGKIIPLLLNGETDSVLPDFISRTNVYIGEFRYRKADSWIGRETFENQGMYKGFLKLLHLLFVDNINIKEKIINYDRLFDLGIDFVLKSNITETDVTTVNKKASQKKLLENSREKIEY